MFMYILLSKLACTFTTFYVHVFIHKLDYIHIHVHAQNTQVHTCGIYDVQM